MTVPVNLIPDSFRTLFLPPADRVAYAADIGAAAYANRFGAAHDRTAWFRLRTVSGNLLVSVGLAVPSDDTETVIVRQGQQFNVTVPVGQGVWVKRAGASDVVGSVEVWLHS